MIRPPVVLDAKIAVCPSTRTVFCLLADTCARAIVDGRGRVTQDFSIEARPGGSCGYYLAAHLHRPVVQVAGPKVHESPVRK